MFWDIRIPSKPVAALNKDYSDGDPLYSHEGECEYFLLELLIVFYDSPGAQ